MDINLSLFPSKPTYAGIWWTISFEPIVGSGERLNVIIAARGNDNKIEIIQSIKDEVLDAIYGYKADLIQDMIKWVIQSAFVHLGTHLTLEKWKLNRHGFNRHLRVI